MAADWVDTSETPCPNCGETVRVPPGAVAMCGVCGATVRGEAKDPTDLSAEIARLERRRRRWRRIALPLLTIGVAGWFGFAAAAVVLQDWDPRDEWARTLLPFGLLGGKLGCVLGVGALAAARSRWPTWGIAGLLGPLGVTLVWWTMVDRTAERITLLRQQSGERV